MSKKVLDWHVCAPHVRFDQPTCDTTPSARKPTTWSCSTHNGSFHWHAFDRSNTRSRSCANTRFQSTILKHNWSTPPTCSGEPSSSTFAIHSAEATRSRFRWRCIHEWKKMPPRSMTPIACSCRKAPKPTRTTPSCPHRPPPRPKLHRIKRCRPKPRKPRANI